MAKPKAQVIDEQAGEPVEGVLVQYTGDDDSGREDDGGILIVERAFYFPICDGPMVVVRPGQRVLVKDKAFMEMLFYSNRAKLDLPEMTTYEAVRPFRFVGADGLYKHVTPGDRLTMTAAEALPLLRTRHITIIEEMEDNK
jgi:hypothetical protein